jgi:DNA polymerase III gamma/tau subunit
LKTYFNSIYGNADGIRYFTDAIESGKLAHAYILEGPAGSGSES